jgi:hypothetical protein
MLTTAAERRRTVLTHARDRRRLKAAEREGEATRRAAFLGGAIGLVVGVALGQLFWGSALAGPSIAAVIGLAVGACVGVLLAGERPQRRERPAVAAPKPRAERAPVATPVREAPRAAAGDDDFLVPPGFYPDPAGGARSRWWDGARWTAKRAA